MKFPFTGPISEYNMFKPEKWKCMTLKTAIKGLIVIGKRRLEVDPFFSVSWKSSRFVDPRIMMTIQWNREKKHRER